jgi:spermidine/putrescine transport system permease protein
LALPTGLVTLACFVVPLGLILVYSFGSENLITFNVDFGWTTANYRAFGSTLYLDTLLRSVVLSVGTTVACAILGLTLAYFISRQGARTQRLLLAAVIIPFWTSFIVRTYSWVDVLQNDGPLDSIAHTLGIVGPDSHINLLYTPFSIGVGIVYSYLPLMILPIYVSLERIDPAIYNAGADLGATPWRQFRRIVLPLARPGLIAGSIIVGVPAMGEYVIPEILGGGKTLMVGNIIANQFQETGNYPFGSALSVTLMALLLVVLFVLRRYQVTGEPAPA